MVKATHYKILAIFLFGLTLSLLSGGKVHAATPADACFNFNSGTGTIEDYYDYEDNDNLMPACTRDVDIPATIASTAVTAIGNNSFSNKLLTSVTIPNSVLTIGNSAFHTNQITSVVIPNSVTSLDTMAFYNSGLTSLTLGSSVTTIGDSSFQDNQLTTVVIPDSVTDIDSSAFRNNYINSLTLGNSVTTISSSAFGRNRLTSVIIPDTVTIIGANSFSANLITSLTLGSSVTSIGDSAFGGNQLTSVAIPDSVTTIDPVAFVGNSSLDVYTTEPMFISGDPAQVQQVYDSIRLVQLFTADSSNPNNLQDSVVTEADFIGMDLNGNGNQNDVLGGHLINPVDARSDAISSSDSSGSGLASTGQNTTLYALAGLTMLTLATSAIAFTRRTNS